MTADTLTLSAPVMAEPPPAAEQDEGPPTRTVRVAKELVRLARQVCADRKGRGGNPLKLVDYLDAILRPVITQDHADMIDRIVREGGHGKKGGGKP